MVAKSRPASVTVVSPAAKQFFCAFRSASISLSLLGVGIILSINSMALSVNNPVSSPPMLVISPPSTCVLVFIPASSRALLLAKPACPSTRFMKTGLSGK